MLLYLCILNYFCGFSELLDVSFVSFIFLYSLSGKSIGSCRGRTGTVCVMDVSLVLTLVTPRGKSCTAVVGI